MQLFYLSKLVHRQMKAVTIIWQKANYCSKNSLVTLSTLTSEFEWLIWEFLFENGVSISSVLLQQWLLTCHHKTIQMNHIWTIKIDIMSWAKLLTLQRHSASHQVIVSFTVAYTEKEVTGIKILFLNRGQFYCSALPYVHLHLFGTFQIWPLLCSVQTDTGCTNSVWQVGVGYPGLCDFPSLSLRFSSSL